MIFVNDFVPLPFKEPKMENAGNAVIDFIVSWYNGYMVFWNGLTTDGKIFFFGFIILLFMYLRLISFCFKQQCLISNHLTTYDNLVVEMSELKETIRQYHEDLGDEGTIDESTMIHILTHTEEITKEALKYRKLQDEHE